MPVKPIPPDEPDKPDSKKAPLPNVPTNERPRVTPYRWPEDEDGSKTVRPGHSKRVKGKWMRR